MTVPYFASYPAPCFMSGMFTAYEIQTVRETFHGLHTDTTFEAVTTQAECDEQSPELGPVVFGVYGRTADGPVEHLFDRVSKEAAEETLAKMGVAI